MKKQWYQSKSCWGAMLLALSGVLGSVSGYLTGTLSVEQALQMASSSLAAAWGLYGIRDAQA